MSYADPAGPYNIGHPQGGMRKRMELISREPIFSIRCELANILDVGVAPFGHRRVVNILGGPVTGKRLNGRVLPGGADWQIVAATDASICTRATRWKAMRAR